MYLQCKRRATNFRSRRGERRSLVSPEGRKGDRGGRRKVSRWFRAKGDPQERGWDGGGIPFFVPQVFPVVGPSAARRYQKIFQTRFTTGKKVFFRRHYGSIKESLSLCRM